MSYGVLTYYHALELAQDINNKYKNLIAYSWGKNGMGQIEFLPRMACSLHAQCLQNAASPWSSPQRRQN